MRLYLLPQKRLRVYIFGLCFVLIGIAVGLLRTPPVTTEPYTSEELIAEKTTDGARSIELPGAGSSESSEVKLVTYTIQEGDTLSSIAQKFNTSADSIAYINDISSPDRISVGKQISVMANASGAVVKVSRGDTLWDIAARYGVSVTAVAAANDLDDSDTLAVGQTLLLPGAKPGARPAQVTSRSASFIWPVKGYVSSSFGWRVHPVTGERAYHEGIDIAASTGTKVYAAASGKFTFAAWYAGYGRLITIDHGDGIKTQYGHLSGFEVAKGDYVQAGDLIGYVGQSGTATGPNLHFEVLKGGSQVNPRNYLP